MPKRKVDRRKFVNPKSGVFTELGPEEYDFDDEEEEDSDIQFLDYREINGMGEGKSFVKSRNQKKQRGWLVNPLVVTRPSGKDKLQVWAPFHFTDPWWKITILRTAEGKTHTVYIKDMFALSYELRRDINCGRQGIVPMFFTKDCEPSDPIHEAVTKFVNFLRQTGEETNLNFENVEEMLNRFEESLKPEDSCIAKELGSRFYTRAGLHIKLAQKFPKIFEYIPQLFPKQFLTILAIDEEIIEELNADIDERPWMFGFSQALYADRDLIGCEASWITLVRSGLAEKIKNPYRDALIIYNYLKKDSSSNGHTYRKLNHLKTAEMEDKVTNFEAGLKFLKTKKVVKEKLIYGQFCIFLYRLYKCEENITKGIKKLFLQQMEQTEMLDVNLDSEAFSSIRTDREQLRAAEMIKQYPVVVISGKGGCGKTTVVTKVLSYCECAAKRKLDDDLNKKPEDDHNKTSDNKLPDLVLNIEDADNIQDAEGEQGYLEKSTIDNAENENQNSSDKEIKLTHTCNHGNILYTAPTGKAANLLGRRANTTGYTLHQIIWSYRKYVSDRKDNPDLIWSYRSKNTLVVDECSLVPVTIFSTLLKILMENSCLRRIILLGDVRQLPSIEPGNFLSDIFQSLVTRGCAIELKTNHRAESQLIIDNATKISVGQYPKFDPTQNFKLHRVPEDQAADFTNMVVHKMLRSEEILHSDRNSQFVAFTKKDCQWINDAACIHYNKHPIRDEKNKLTFRVGDKVCMTKNGQLRMFQQGPKGQMEPIQEKSDSPEEAESSPDITLISATQCQTQLTRGSNSTNLLNQEQRQQQSDLHSASNDLDQTLPTDSQKSQEKEKPKFKATRLCNGEIFFIVGDHEEINPSGRKETNRYLELADYDKDEPKRFWVDYRELMRECAMKHAWARTIHTFQGSENEAVIYVVGAVPPGTFGQNWQHVYTAVTRGRKAVHIVGTEMNLLRAVTKRENKRNTGLKYLLINALPKRDKLNESLCQAADTTIDTEMLDTSHQVLKSAEIQSDDSKSNSACTINRSHSQESEECVSSFLNSEKLQNSKGSRSSSTKSVSINEPIADPSKLIRTDNNGKANVSYLQSNQQQSENSEDFMTSFVYSQEIASSSNLNFTKLRASNQSNPPHTAGSSHTSATNIPHSHTHTAGSSLTSATNIPHSHTHTAGSSHTSATNIPRSHTHTTGSSHTSATNIPHSHTHTAGSSHTSATNIPRSHTHTAGSSHTSATNIPRSNTARNMFCGLMFPDGELSDFWSNKSSAVKSPSNLTSSTPLIERVNSSLGGQSNGKVQSPQIFSLDTPIRNMHSPQNITAGHDSQWSEVDEDLLIDLDDIDSGSNTGDKGYELADANRNDLSPLLMTPPELTHKSQNNLDSIGDLTAACYLLEKSQQQRDSQKHNYLVCDDNGIFTKVNGLLQPESAKIQSTNFSSPNLFSPTKRHMIGSSEAVTPKKQRMSNIDHLISVSPARNLLTKLDLTDE